jgi:hypothetical protein
MGKIDLVIISVPLMRNIRHLLYSQLYQELKNRYSILIVSPFGNVDNFKKEFGGQKVEFLNFSFEERHLAFIRGKLYALSEFLRMYGHCFKYRYKGMKYYWHLISKTNQSDEAIPKRVTFLKRVLAYFLGWVGSFAVSWKIVDYLFGNFFYYHGNLMQIYSKKYRNIMLIQTANWGYQDRYLAYCSRKFLYKTVLLSYTTDQTFNGYFICNYDLICLQGSLETMYAEKYHKIPANRILKLGMLWFRNLSTVFQEKPRVKYDKTGIILYASVSNRYYPRKLEEKAVNYILRLITEKKIPFSKIIYRVIPTSDSEIRKLKTKYSNEKAIEIQIAQQACFGLKQYPTLATVYEEVKDYLQSIKKADILIMSCTTSLLFDALYFDIPAISVFFDDPEYLRKFGEHPVLGSDDIVGLKVSGGINIADSLENLQWTIEKTISDIKAHESFRRRFLSIWDYNNANYLNDFFTSVEKLFDTKEPPINKNIIQRANISERLE